MKPCPAHFISGHIKMIVSMHRILYEQEPRQVLVGLKDMQTLERANGLRRPGEAMMIDGVPVAVGGLEDGARCVT